MPEQKEIFGKTTEASAIHIAIKPTDGSPEMIFDASPKTICEYCKYKKDEEIKREDFQRNSCKHGYNKFVCPGIVRQDIKLSYTQENITRKITGIELANGHILSGALINDRGKINEAISILNKII